MERALLHAGVKTNIPFLLNVLHHQQFLQGSITTSFLDENPLLFKFVPSQNRAQKLLSYLSEILVNGPLTPLGTDSKPMNVKNELPLIKTKEIPDGWRQVLLKEGPAGFAKAVRQHSKYADRSVIRVRPTRSCSLGVDLCSWTRRCATLIRVSWRPAFEHWI